MLIFETVLENPARYYYVEDPEDVSVVASLYTTTQPAVYSIVTHCKACYWISHLLYLYAYNNPILPQ